jgi:hypothetical protein
MALVNLLPLGRRDAGSESPASIGSDGDRDRRVRELLAGYLREARLGQQTYLLQIRPANFPSGRALLGAEPSLQVAAVLAATEQLLPLVEGLLHGQDVYALRALLPQLCRRTLPYGEADVRRLLGLLAASGATWGSWFPIQSVIKSVERWVTEHGIAAGVRSELERLEHAGQNAVIYADERKALLLIEAMLAGPAPNDAPFDPNDDWGYAALHHYTQLDIPEQASWRALLDYAATANGSKPTKPWLKRASERLDGVGRERSQTILCTCLGFMGALARPAPSELPSSRIDMMGDVIPTSLLTERNGTLLKGLAWCCSPFADPVTATAVADAAEACFKKIPSVGARSTKAGNACLYALGAMPGLHGAAQLQRLRQRVKQPSAIAQIDAALETAARREGMTREDLDDLAVPTFDLVACRRREQFGDYAAEIVVAGTQQIDVRWFGPDGEPRKSEPADVKRRFPDEAKALKQTADDLRKTLGAQRDRIERILMTERSWPFADWQARYLDHPLLSLLSRRLIWCFDEGDGSRLGAWHDGVIAGVDDRPLDRIGERTRVRLWHPIAADAATVDAWQGWLERHGVTQPFKQAHREVYVLTDAERATETYSNRFAGHIVRQHQFQALCQQRGWTYRLQGGFDNANTPTLDLPAWDLAAEFWVEPVVDGEESLSPSGVSLHVGTDQVQFRRRRLWQPLAVEEVPPLVFTEVMRDVDLFVAVCSVGNDPTWADRGPQNHQVYWHSVAFAEDLTASARTRRTVLERLIPRLKIASRCSIADRFLVVRGDLRTYKIHLGSGNVLMEPNNQYLCIVPKRGGGANDPAQGVFLPFEGDGMLTVILSKAFMLADDRSITDPTITRQIAR